MVYWVVRVVEVCGKVQFKEVCAKGGMGSKLCCADEEAVSRVRV